MFNDVDYELFFFNNYRIVLNDFFFLQENIFEKKLEKNHKFIIMCLKLILAINYIDLHNFAKTDVYVNVKLATHKKYRCFVGLSFVQDTRIATEISHQWQN